MSSSESSYTWDDWYNRHNPNNEKNRRLDKQHHEVAVLKQQRDELLAALRGLRDAFIGTSVEVQADAMRAARAAIAKAGGES